MFKDWLVLRYQLLKYISRLMTYIYNKNRHILIELNQTLRED